MKPRVLLVDDSPDFVEYTRRRLVARGFPVVTSADGESALETIQNHKVDVVILDILMPGLDGLHTLKRIKERHPVVEVIMLTGHGTISLAAEGVRLGAADYLLKPADFDSLLGAIDNAFRKRHRSPESS